MQGNKISNRRWHSWGMIILFIAGIMPASHAQDLSPDTDKPFVADTLLKVFLNGEWIDEAYLRKEMPFVNYVRDQNLADVQILITSVYTASGGKDYHIEFIGKMRFRDINYDLSYLSSQEETWYQQRRGLVHSIKMGLLPFLSQTEGLNDFSLTYNGPHGFQKNGLENGDDPWNHWIFQIGADGSYYKEASIKEYSYSTSVDASRVTDKWKFRSDLYTRNHVSEFQDTSTVIHSVNSYTDFRSSLVKSVSGRWSSGLFGRVQHSTYRNYAVAFDIAPAIEYNIFPWEDVDRREFTVAYHVGIQNNRYIQTTLFDKNHETLGYHSININFQMIQPWGNINSSLVGASFFRDFSLYSIQLDAHVSARLTKNLSFRVSLNAESVHNQIYLPAGDASLTEILMQQRSLATTYQYSFSAGLQFTFGSIYNNVVNRRL